MLRLAVIGCPIAHSRSPQIHRAILESLNVEYQYEKSNVTEEDLPQFLEYAKSNLDGFNLTMPLKTDILPYLDGISEKAKFFESVNTVKVDKGKLYGFNTDAGGYIRALMNKGVNPENKRIVIIGAGGVVRTLAKELVSHNVKETVILNRTSKKAVDVAASVGSNEVKGMELTDENIIDCCRFADILINATPLGMEGCDCRFESLAFINELPKGAIVSDLIYAPPKTELLKTAEKAGYKVMNGFDMLIFQAILADEIYLDKKLDMKKIYTDVIKRV